MKSENEPQTHGTKVSNSNTDETDEVASNNVKSRSEETVPVTTLSIIEKHCRNSNVNYHMVLRFVLLHAIAIEGMRRIKSASEETLLWAFILSFLR